MKKRAMGWDANASLMGLIVATGLFSVSFSYVVYTAYNQPNPDDKVQGAEAHAIAASLADLILNQPGQNWYVSGACDDGYLTQAEFFPDTVLRFGLAEERCDASDLRGAPNALSYHKVRAIHRAGIEADPANRKADYIEARDSLRLSESGYAFHLSASPVLADAQQALAQGLRTYGARPLLIGSFGDPQRSYIRVANEHLVDQQLNKYVWGGIVADLRNDENLGGIVDDQYCDRFPTQCTAERYDPSDHVILESAYLEQLVPSFNRAVTHVNFQSKNPDAPKLDHDADGAIFPDVADYLEEHLTAAITDEQGRGVLDKYNVIVIGAGAKPAAFGGLTVKTALAEWLEAGGYLIITGPNQPTNWMLSLVGAHFVGDNPGQSLRAEDNHEVINVPEPRLSYSTYDPRAHAWVFQGASENHFEKVIWGHTSSRALLAISKGEGEFGDGRVLLSSFRLSDLMGATPAVCLEATLNQGGLCESIVYLHHLLTVPFSDLYVNYGPEVPRGVPIGTHTRLVVVNHPRFGGSIDLLVTVKAWSTGYVPLPDLGDTQKPSPVGAIVGTGTGSTTIRIQFPPASDNVGVHHYRVERSLDQLQSPSWLLAGEAAQDAGAALQTFNDQGLTPLTTYIYRVAAVDAAGNQGDWSSPSAPITTLASLGGGGGGGGGGGCGGGLYQLWKVDSGPTYVC
jgi:hypothetical protein